MMVSRARKGRFRMRSPLVLLALAALLATSCGFGSRNRGSDPAETLAAARAAHDSYVAAINANRLDEWMAALTDDVVYLVPNHEPIVGKPNVGAWAAGYLDESSTHWTKSTQDLQVSGDWAFAWYVYSVSDTLVIKDSSVDGGGTSNDTGWGLVIYRRGPDGAWRVARDAWGSARPAR
jgi:ketosteroid isomerase-like protein